MAFLFWQLVSITIPVFTPFDCVQVPQPDAQQENNNNNTTNFFPYLQFQRLE